MSKPGHPFFYEEYETYHKIKSTYQFVKESRAVDIFSTSMTFPYRWTMAILIPLGIVLCVYMGMLIAVICGFTDVWMAFISPYKGLLNDLASWWWVYLSWAIGGRWAFLLCGPNVIGHYLFKTLVYAMWIIVILASIVSIVFGILIAIRIFLDFIERF